MHIVSEEGRRWFQQRHGAGALALAEHARVGTFENQLIGTDLPHAFLGMAFIVVENFTKSSKCEFDSFRCKFKILRVINTNRKTKKKKKKKKKKNEKIEKNLLFPCFFFY
jgi:hypothetical protein